MYSKIVNISGCTTMQQCNVTYDIYPSIGVQLEWHCKRIKSPLFHFMHFITVPQSCCLQYKFLKVMYMPMFTEMDCKDIYISSKGITVVHSSIHSFIHSFIQVLSTLQSNQLILPLCLHMNTV